MPQQQEPSVADALKCLILGPVTSVVAALLGSASFMLSHLVMTLTAAPSVYIILARTACVSKKIGPIAKVFALIVLIVPVAVAIPVLTLYGGIAGLCWGAISGMTVCNSPNGIGSGLRGAWDALYQAQEVFSGFTKVVKQECNDELQRARTTELGPSEEPVELNPVKAALAILAGIISGTVGAAAYLLVGIRVIAPITLSTWRFIAAMEIPMPITVIGFIMTPIVVVFIVLIYPFIGFMVCFLAAGTTLYTELDLVQLQRKIIPPKPQKQPKPAAKSRLPSFWRRRTQQPETNEINEPQKQPKAATKSWLPSFGQQPAQQPETNEPQPQINEPQKQSVTKSWLPSFGRRPVEQPEIIEPLLAPTVATTERGCCNRIGHLVGVTGIPFAMQSTAQCIQQWWQLNWQVAQNGPREIYERTVGACKCCAGVFTCCASCLTFIDNCLSCGCCCCWKSSNGREMDVCAQQSLAPEANEECTKCGDILAIPPEQSEMDSEHKLLGAQ